MQTRTALGKLPIKLRIPENYCRPQGFADFLSDAQHGDAGKGRTADYLAQDYDIVARCNGGPNAGHTIVLDDGTTVVVHIMPSGVLQPHVKLLIGNGVFVNPCILNKEMTELTAMGINLKGRVFIHQKCHIIKPTDRLLDAAEEWKNGGKVGTTMMGMGPVIRHKVARNGIRLGDYLTLPEKDFKEKYLQLKADDIEEAKSWGFDVNSFRIENMTIDEYEALWFESLKKIAKNAEFVNSYWLNNQIRDGARVLIEGAQGTMLDPDQGDYPFVTSSNTTIGGALNGLGIPASVIRKVIFVSKFYHTRVGNGPFPTERKDKFGQDLQQHGQEEGRTTKRPRRCGDLDLMPLRLAAMVNGITDWFFTKADIMDGMPHQVCIGYLVNGEIKYEIPYEANTKDVEPVYIDLPQWTHATQSDGTLADEVEEFCDFIEEYTGIPVTWVSVGAERSKVVERHKK